MERVGLLRLLQAALLTASAAVGVAYFGFGPFEVAVAMLGASALAATGEVALASRAAGLPEVAEPEAGEPIVWSLDDLRRRAETRAGRDPVRDQQRAQLLERLRAFADERGTLPGELDGLVRESFPDLVG